MTFVPLTPGAEIVSTAKMAFGANPDTDPGTWTWTDVTRWVRGTAVIGKGKPNNSPTADPSRLGGLTLDNNDGRFSPDNAMGPYFGFLVPYVPVQLGISGFGDPLLTPYERITAFVDGWQILPNAGLIDVVVPLSASGRLKRIGKDNKPLHSPMYRAIADSSPVAYWSLEDGPKATAAASAVSGVPALKILGNVAYGSITGPAGSASLPDFSQGASFRANVPIGSTSSWRVECVVQIPTTSALSDNPAILDFTTGGTSERYVIYAGPSGFNLSLVRYTSGATTGYNASGATAAMNDGVAHHIRMDGTTSGGTYGFTVYYDGVAVMSDSGLAGTLGAIRSIRGNSGSTSGFAAPSTEFTTIGHVAVYAPFVGSANTYQAFLGYSGELADTRLIRIGAENGLTVATVGTSTAKMGVQPVASLPTILQQSPDTDGGLLHDGGAGGNLEFGALPARYNATPALTLYYASSHISDGLTGARDDVGLYNDTFATRADGSQAEAADTVSILAVGENDRTISPNPLTDIQLAQILSWATHVSSYPASRFPVVSIDLRRSPDLVPTIVATKLIGSRILLKGLPGKTYGYNDIDLFIEGYTETIDAVTWRIDLFCSAGGPYQVAQLGSATNGHLDPASCVLAGGGWNGSAGTFTTTTTGGPLLTTNGADFPVDINLNGQRVTISGVSGASNPQTVTVSVASVNGVVKSHPAGEALSLWQPFILAL